MQVAQVDNPRIQSLLTNNISPVVFEKNPASKSYTMDFLTLNTWLRPAPLGKDNFARADRIANSLSRYDVVGLQETFSAKGKHITETAEKNKTQPYSYRQNQIKILTNSGLTTLSKYQVIEQDFRPFSFSTISDSLAKKGVMFTRIVHPQIGEIDVYDTHYQAGGAEKDFKPSPLKRLVSLFNPGYDLPKDIVRMSQTRDFSSLLQKHEKGNPTVIMGDFNFTENSPEYRDFVNKMQVKDSFRIARPKDPGYTSDGQKNPNVGGESRSRIDFIFFKPGKTVGVDVVSSKLAFNEPVLGMFVSDHFGVHSTLKFTKKN